MSTIFLRGGKFLSAQYKWEAIPHLFPEWQVPAVVKLMAGWKDAADGMAVVDGSAVIDLDALEVREVVKGEKCTKVILNLRSSYGRRAPQMNNAPLIWVYRYRSGKGCFGVFVVPSCAFCLAGGGG